MNIIEKPLTSKMAMLRQTQGTRCQSGRRIAGFSAPALGRKT
jgi:hypothetical protein